MAFKMNYTIEQKLLPYKSKRRSGAAMARVGFIVAHDTGNDGSTAAGNVNYYTSSADDISASAHTFIDHKQILECIPATIGSPEKAWHVLYDITLDNQIYGDDANDTAIGVELCYSYKKGSINNEEAYKRYVWYLAYLCYKFTLNPLKDIIGHNTLDPKRKTDPINALQHLGKSFNNLILDVAAQYKECSGKTLEYSPNPPSGTILCKGSKGEAVRKLQLKLNTIGFLLDADGDFGSGTEEAVRSFQQMAGLAIDGQAGNITMATIDGWIKEAADKMAEGENEKLNLLQWQVDMLAEALSKLQAAGMFESKDWITKTKNNTLTTSELSFLNTIILSKGVN